MVAMFQRYQANGSSQFVNSTGVRNKSEKSLRSRPQVAALAYYTRDREDELAE